jgi:PKHD-type hydroxylase
MNVKYNYWFFQSALTKEFCNNIVARHKSSKDKIQGKIGSIKNYNVKNIKNLKKTRNSKVVFLEDKEIFAALQPYVFTANKNAGWNFQWDASENVQFTEYRKNNHYTWHQDSCVEPYQDVTNPFKFGKIRKLSMTCSLTDPSKYKGGELEFWLPNPTMKSGGQVITCKEILPQGSIVVFPSFMWHRVKPVTKGVRHSLVMWNLGKPYV